MPTHPAIARAPSITPAPSPFRLTGSPRLRQNIGICHRIKLRLIRKTGAAGRGPGRGRQGLGPVCSVAQAAVSLAGPGEGNDSIM
jgi:hypothetical protein